MSDTVETLVVFLVVAKAIEYVVAPLYFFTQQKMLFKNQEEIKAKLEQNTGTTDHIVEIKELLQLINVNQLEMTNNQNQILTSNGEVSTEVDENEPPPNFVEIDLYSSVV